MSVLHVNENPLLNSVHPGEEWPLIEAGDPNPFTLYNPDGDAPFLLVCDHASREFPAAMRQLGLADWVLDKHVACDIGAANVTRLLSDRFNAPAVLAGYSRLIVDVNRQLHDAGAFVEVSDGIAIPGNLDLSDEEKDLRVQSFFRPYHDEITRQLERFQERGHVPALLSIHSCTPVFNNVVRQWHIGVMYDQDTRIAHPLLEALNQNEDICAGDNEPYSGEHPNDFTIDFHAETTGLPCVGVEVRQDLIDTPEGVEKWGGILGDGFESALATPDLFRRKGTED